MCKFITIFSDSITIFIIGFVFTTVNKLLSHKNGHLEMHKRIPISQLEHFSQETSSENHENPEFQTAGRFMT